MKQKLDLILFDFHNVLCNGYFYTNIAQTHPASYQKIVNILFTEQGHTITSQWMRGELSYQNIHEIISPVVGLSASFLDDSLVESVKQMQLNKLLFDFSQEIRKHGVKIAILTDNMDVFEDIYVPHMGLDTSFDAIFSSSRQKKLKLDDDGRLIFSAIAQLDARTQHTLFIDDMVHNGMPLVHKGGLFYHYQNYTDNHDAFVSWFDTMIYS